MATDTKVLMVIMGSYLIILLGITNYTETVIKHGVPGTCSPEEYVEMKSTFSFMFEESEPCDGTNAGNCDPFKGLDTSDIEGTKKEIETETEINSTDISNIVAQSPCMWIQAVAKDREGTLLGGVLDTVFGTACGLIGGVKSFVTSVVGTTVNTIVTTARVITTFISMVAIIVLYPECAGIPTQLSILVFAPMVLGVSYIISKLAKGGG